MLAGLGNWSRSPARSQESTKSRDAQMFSGLLLTEFRKLTSKINLGKITNRRFMTKVIARLIVRVVIIICLVY